MTLTHSWTQVVSEQLLRKQEDREHRRRRPLWGRIRSEFLSHSIPKSSLAKKYDQHSKRMNLSNKWLTLMITQGSNFPPILLSSESPSMANRAHMNISPIMPPFLLSALSSVLLRPFAAAAPGEPPYECMMSTISLPSSINGPNNVSRMKAASVATKTSFGFGESTLGRREEMTG